MIADSGLQLALAAGQSTLAREFGLPASGCRISLDHLKQHMLPVSALALLFEDQMKNNFIRCDQKFPRESEAPKRALAYNIIYNVIRIEDFFLLSGVRFWYFDWLQA